MKTLTEVDANKLRGGFYTPSRLVNVCLDRIYELNGHQERFTVLEPSVGDGAFLRGLISHSLAGKVDSFLGIELIATEAQKCRDVGQIAPFKTTVITGSALEWASQAPDRFDVVVGNPPFVRYQFIPSSDLRKAELLRIRLSLPLRGVSNLWIPVLLGSLEKLRVGGTFALVVPAELFTGLSAGDARYWLLANSRGLRVDMFEPGSFPGALQEVVVISGRRITCERRPWDSNVIVEFVEHSPQQAARRWTHLVPIGSENWTRYLLTPEQLTALSEARCVQGVRPFGTAAKLEVSIVTGANDYFSVTEDEVKEFELEPWALPLLPRFRHATGLIYTSDDQEATAKSGAKAWLLDFSSRLPDPHYAPGPLRYLAIGENRGLNLRYKTRIRTPWYRVPSIRSGELMLSKRCHRFPKLVLNAAGVLTTDTIYRGRMLPQYSGQGLDLVFGFHNSLTLLSAELEGRSFGGGVLEIVPSEISRLSIPFPTGIADAGQRLDDIARSLAHRPDGAELLIEETDRVLAQKVKGLTSGLLRVLSEARQSLVKRRLSRN